MEPARPSTAPADLDPAAQALATLGMVAEAQRRGLSWAQIASALGAENGKAAKAQVKRLARAVQARLLAEAAKGPDAA